jgi:hypothetical protein
MEFARSLGRLAALLIDVRFDHEALRLFLRRALNHADDKLSIPKLFQGKELLAGKDDEKSVMTLVSKM